MHPLAAGFLTFPERSRAVAAQEGTDAATTTGR